MRAGSRTRRAAALLALLGLGLGAARAAHAQVPEAAPALAAPGPPRAIAGPEVADRAQQEADALRELRARAEPAPEIVAIKEQLVASAEEVAGLAGRERERLAVAPSRRELDRARFEFERLQERLAGWSAVLSARAGALDRDLELLAGRRALWAATREKAVAERQASAVLARVDKTLASLDRAERTLRERRDEILTVRESVARQQSTVEEMLALVEEGRKERRKTLLALDGPPLWEVLLSDRGTADGLLGRMSVVRAHDLDDLARWAREESEQLLLLGLLSAGVVLAAVALRRPAHQLAERDELLAPYARILERPIAAGLVVALLGGAVLVAKAPPAVVAVHGFVLLLAVVRLLVPLVEPDLRLVLYGLTAWYAVDRLRDRLAADPLANRLVLLLAAILAVLAVLWLQRPQRLAQLGHLAHRPGWLRVIAFGMRVALVFSGVSILANLVGNTTLAELLVEGTVATAWLAFVFYGGSRVLLGAWVLLIRSGAARSLRMVRNHELLVLRRGRSLIQAGLVAGWAWASLAAFDAAEPALAAARAVLGAHAQLGELRLSLGGLLGFALMVWVSLLTSRFVRFALEEDVLSRASLPRGVAFAVSTLARYAILLVGFAMAVLAAGFDLSKLALILGALGVGIGIGLQDVVNNFVSGLILLFERPVQVGDLVNVGEVMGEVRRIGIRSSTVRRFDGAEVVIPNSKLVSESFVNWTLSDRLRRIEIPVGVAYGNEPERVIEILEGVVRARPELLEEPPPLVLFDRFGESSLDFLVRVWTSDLERFRSQQSRLAVDIYRALREAGIQIPFPQRDVHVRSLAPGLQDALQATGDAASAQAPPPPAPPRGAG
jgi:small-conductance mechanosensitive channel